jgi:hypothetical protein
MIDSGRHFGHPPGQHLIGYISVPRRALFAGMAGVGDPVQRVLTIPERFAAGCPQRSDQ